MSYTVDLIIESLPINDNEAWIRVEKLRNTYYDDKREKSPKLVELHKRLTAIYPCLCSYADSDPLIDECPWADGPMINNFSHEMGLLAIVYSRVEEVVPIIIREANALGISVADGQTEEIHRPEVQRNQTSEKKRWWSLWK